MKTKNLNRLCPICASTVGKIIRKIEMNLPQEYGLQSGYDVVCCEQCGFTYADVKASQSDYNHYYAQCNIYGGTQSIRQDIDNNINSLRCDIIRKYVDTKGAVIDIGCGNGGVLRKLKEMGFSDLYGIDPSQESIDLLHEVEIPGKVGNVFDALISLPIRQYDMVISTTVIEHIYDLKGYVACLKSYMKEDGLLFVDAPAVEGFSINYTPLPNQFNHEHINYFSIRSLDNLMKANGLRRVNTDSECMKEIKVADLPEWGLECIYTNDKSVENDIVYDESSLEAIKKYIQIADNKWTSSLEKLKNFLRDNPKVVLWGTGAYSMSLLSEVEELQNALICCVDGNICKIGSYFAKKKIISPEDALRIYGKQYPIVICSMRNTKDIINRIEELDCSWKYTVI